jgi:hypothetical protein
MWLCLRKSFFFFVPCLSKPQLQNTTIAAHGKHLFPVMTVNQMHRCAGYIAMEKTTYYGLLVNLIYYYRILQKPFFISLQLHCN